MAMVRFGDVAERVNTKEDRYNTDIEFYVGGDHIESNALTVSGRGRIKEADLGPMFYFGFKPGDILFVTRNPHLRKSAKVDFPGICSEKTLVIATKDENVLMQNYLAGVMQSDDFWDFMEGNKSGSVNFFINWSTLADYEFDLPSLDRQRELAELLWAANDLKEKYKKLITASDEMLKAKFREMFGECKEVSFGEAIIGMRNGVSPSRRGACTEKVLTLSAVTQGRFDPNEWKEARFDNLPPDAQRVKTGEFYICRGNGNKHLVGAGVFSVEDRKDLVFPDTVIAAQISSDKLLVEYLYYAWSSVAVRKQIETFAITTNGIYKISQESLVKIQIPLPPLDLQRQFVEIAAQEEKVKANLKKSIADVDNIIKGLING